MNKVNNMNVFKIRKVNFRVNHCGCQIRVTKASDLPLRYQYFYIDKLYTSMLYTPNFNIDIVDIVNHNNFKTSL